MKKKQCFGTWEEVTKIMELHGFEVKKGVKPQGMVLLIREMLSLAFIKGYAWKKKMDLEEEFEFICNECHKSTFCSEEPSECGNCGADNFGICEVE